MRSFYHTSRRRFITPTTAGLIASPVALPETKTPVQSVIDLFMNGRMTHRDTFGPKIGTNTAPSISTNIPGIFISGNLPSLAGYMEKNTLVRSVSHISRNHESPHNKLAR